MESRVKRWPEKRVGLQRLTRVGLAAVASSFMTGGQGGFGKDRGGVAAEDMTRRATSGNIPEKEVRCNQGGKVHA